MVWPDSVLKLCHFHIMQSVWRWLWDSKHEIAKADRQVLMGEFRKVLYAQTEVLAAQLFDDAVKSATDHEYSRYPLL